VSIFSKRLKTMNLFNNQAVNLYTLIFLNIPLITSFPLTLVNIESLGFPTLHIRLISDELISKILLDRIIHSNKLFCLLTIVNNNFSRIIQPLISFHESFTINILIEDYRTTFIRHHFNYVHLSNYALLSWKYSNFIVVRPNCASSALLASHRYPHRFFLYFVSCRFNHPNDDRRFPNYRLVFGGHRTISMNAVYPGISSVFDELTPKAFSNFLQPINLNTPHASSLLRFCKNCLGTVSKVYCGYEEMFISELKSILNFTINKNLHRPTRAFNPSGTISVNKILNSNSLQEIRSTSILWTMDVSAPRIVFCEDLSLFKWNAVLRNSLVWLFFLLLSANLILFVCKGFISHNAILNYVCIYGTKYLYCVASVIIITCFTQLWNWSHNQKGLKDVLTSGATIYFDSESFAKEYYRFEAYIPSRMSWHNSELVEVLKNNLVNSSYHEYIKNDRFSGVTNDLSYLTTASVKKTSFAYITLETPVLQDVTLRKLSDTMKRKCCAFIENKFRKDFRYAVFDNKLSGEMRALSLLYSQRGLLSFWERLEHKKPNNDQARHTTIRNEVEQSFFSVNYTFFAVSFIFCLFTNLVGFVIYKIETIHL